MKKLFLCPLLVGIAGGAHGHVRWFVETEKIPPVSFEFGVNTLFILLAAGMYVTVMLFLNQYAKVEKSPLGFLNKSWQSESHLDWYLLLPLLNLALVLCLLHGDYLAPNLLLPESTAILGVFIQALVIVMLPLSPTITGIAIAMVALLNIRIFGINLSIDYAFELLGVGLALMFIGPNINRFDLSLCRFLGLGAQGSQGAALWCLRVGLGLQLMTLGIHNKFMDTGISLMFLEQFPHFNFMQFFGWKSFEHLDFIFAAGLFETLFGLMLVLGMATRLVAMTLVGIFTLTTVVAGVEELAGHLPIFGVLIILVSRYQSSELSWWPGTRSLQAA